MENRLYFTTPLYYVNAHPHMGHYYTTLLADVLKRHYVQRGIQVFALTGTDEHGEKIEQSARKAGKEPREFVDGIADEFRETWKKMGIELDVFYRTTDPAHVRKVQWALQTLKDKGEIVFREYEGNYCTGCERFMTDSELTGDGLCPDHRRKPEFRKESNYFFLMSQYQQKIIQHLENNPKYIQPEHYRTEILSFLKQPLTDLCISRPRSRLNWGIELPFDSNYVTYVWFDALLNYLCATGWPGEAAATGGEKFNSALWSTCTHLIAKDILKTHCVYWPAMLMALQVSLPKGLYVHGYWISDGNKMSKSLGNGVGPIELEERFGKDTLRFVLMREMSFGFDANFTPEMFVTSINAYLANGIGNLVSRVVTLCQKNFKGQLDVSALTEADQKLLELRKSTLDLWDRGFQEVKFQNSLKSWSDLVTAVDLYVNEMKPWALAKDPAQNARLQNVLGVCLLMIQTLGVLIYPVLPQAARSILTGLGISADPVDALSLATEMRDQFALADGVPKLFMRVQLPQVETPTP